MCGHGIIAVVTIAIERGLIATARGDGLTIVLDAPAGQIRARARVDDAPTAGAARRSRVVRQRAVVRARAGRAGRASDRATLPVDVAFGGAFYAIVDAEAAGLPVVARAADRSCAQTGMAIARAVEARSPSSIPTEPGLTGIYGTIFTGPPTVRRRGSAQRDDLRGRRSRSIALRHRHVRGAGRARRDGPRRSDRGRSCTRASSARRSARASSIARRSAISRRSCRSSPARRGSPASTRSSSIRTIRWRKGSESSARAALAAAQGADAGQIDARHEVAHGLDARDARRARVHDEPVLDEDRDVAELVVAVVGFDSPETRRSRRPSCSHSALLDGTCRRRRSRAPADTSRRRPCR